MWIERAMTVMRWITRLSAYLGGGVLLVCVAVTVTDVVKRNFLGSSVLGAVELTQLCVMWAAFLTIPLGFAFGSHISVDVFVAMGSERVQTLLMAANMLVAALVMAGFLYWGGAQALHSLMTRELTLTLGLPVWLYWLPIVYGTALSVLAAAVSMLAALAGRHPGIAGRGA